MTDRITAGRNGIVAGIVIAFVVGMILMLATPHTGMEVVTFATGVMVLIYALSVIVAEVVGWWG